MWFCPTQDRMCRSLESTPWPWVAEYVKHLERHGKCTMIVVTTIVRFSTEESLESCESMIFTKPVYSFQCPIYKENMIFNGAFKTPRGFEHQTGPKKYLLNRKLELDWVKSLHIPISLITFFVSVFLIPRSIFSCILYSSSESAPPLVFYSKIRSTLYGAFEPQQFYRRKFSSYSGAELKPLE